MTDNIYQDEFCTFITLVFDPRLPPFYLGSAPTKKVLSGYHGTPRSKKYKEIWQEVVREGTRITTLILYTHPTQVERIAEERRLGILFNIVKSPLFINMKLAAANDILRFGRTKENDEGTRRAGENISIALKGRTKETHEGPRKVSEKIKGRTKETHEYLQKMGEKISEIQTGRTKETHEGNRKQSEKISIIQTGKPHPQKQVTCPHCGLTGAANNMKRYHGDNCKFKNKQGSLWNQQNRSTLTKPLPTSMS